ncbi:MAG: excisionase family DNA-binding protein [Kaistella sp.]|nr:excisionase family DNA-binding protein [Kaistella sp.]
MITQDFMSIKEVSARTGLSRQHIYKLIGLGKFPSHKPFGRKYFFLWDEVYSVMKGENSGKPTTKQNTVSQ